MFIHKWHEPYLPLLHRRRASQHLAGTHFTIQRRVEGRVNLGGWLHTEIKYRPRESNQVAGEGKSALARHLAVGGLVRCKQVVTAATRMVQSHSLVGANVHPIQ